MQLNEPELIIPQWDAPDSISACCTTRHGGVSNNGFSSLNLATHVDDDAAQVATNRRRLGQFVKLPEEPQWLVQSHSINAIDLDKDSNRRGDAAYSCKPETIAVVLTADCLPVLFCNKQGNEIAAAHAGWRGLLNGILRQTVTQMKSDASDMMVWLGPAIGPLQFEVGAEVKQAFIANDDQNYQYFTETRAGHYLADLYALARLQLKKMGIMLISGGNFCTYSDSERFYSFRRQKITGRQASLIYIKK